MAIIDAVSSGSGVKDPRIVLACVKPLLLPSDVVEKKKITTD